MVVVHMVCSLLSYGAFLAAFVAGLMFLLQERQLKRQQMGRLFHRLPSLETLDRANFIAIGIGFVLLSLGLSTGFIVAGLLLGHWWTGDPKEWLTVVLWSCYLVLVVFRVRASLRGHRVAVLSILGFSLVLFTFLGVNWLLPTWHSSV